jgi:hypothetical protein
MNECLFIVTIRLDGEMKDEEKEHFDEILNSLTSLSRSGEYLLLKQFFVDGQINPDWPFYSKTDSILVKKSLFLFFGKSFDLSHFRKILDNKSASVRPSSSSSQASIAVAVRSSPESSCSVSDQRMQQRLSLVSPSVSVRRSSLFSVGDVGEDERSVGRVDRSRWMFRRDDRRVRTKVVGRFVEGIRGTSSSIQRITSIHRIGLEAIRATRRRVSSRSGFVFLFFHVD